MSQCSSADSHISNQLWGLKPSITTVYLLSDAGPLNWSEAPVSDSSHEALKAQLLLTRRTREQHNHPLVPIGGAVSCSS